jgi:hypothetical protein
MISLFFGIDIRDTDHNELGCVCNLLYPPGGLMFDHILLKNKY